MRNVSLVAAYNSDGKLLFGRRNDNGKWTLPGGHAKAGESAEKCAVRELVEETGLKPTGLKQLDVREVRNGTLKITTFQADVEGTPSGKNDPDDECSEWKWVDVSDGVPKDIADNMHGPKSEDDNVVMALFGLKKSTRMWKDEVTPAQETEVDRLLQHADPAEKMMALRLAGVRPHHVMNILDGDPDVAAVGLSSPAANGDVLHAALQRPHLRQLVLSVPQVQPEHLRAAFSASQGQPDADDIVDALVGHPMTDENLLRYMWSNGGPAEMLRHPSVPTDVLEDAYAKGSPDHKTLAIGHPNMPANRVGEVLLRGTGDEQLFAAAAPNVPVEVAREMLQRGRLPTDEAQARVRRALIENERVPREIVTLALHDLDPQTKLLAMARLGSEGEMVKKETPKVEAGGQEALTIRGKPAKVKNVDKPVFDEKKGVLHTPRGSFPMYVPSRDSESAKTSFHNIMSDPKVNQFHDYAMQNWTKVNKALKNGTLPPQVVMHATLFSQQSPNTPVPVQELMYGHLVDAMNHTGVDATDPQFAEKVGPNWNERDSATQPPSVSPEHWDRLGNLIRVKGDEAKRPKGSIMSFMLANNKMANMAKYHKLHNQLVDLVQRHRGDARSGVAELMTHKRLATNHENVRKRHLSQGKPDIGEYTAGPAVAGLAPKTARYTYGMMGGGNVQVPDTHFTRYLFGLEKGKDNHTIDYLKSLLWNEGNGHVLEGIDRHYAQHHDAVQHMMQHPTWGKHFEKPEDAIFPAFWKNWVGIAPHEKARGLKTSAFNEYTDHRPYWDVIRPFLKKSEGPDESLPARTALQHAEWAREYGDVPAMLLYYRHLVPMLLGEQDQLTKDEMSLEKMAIASIPKGKLAREKSQDLGMRRYDYSHVLSPEHRAAGFSLMVDHRRDASEGTHQVRAVLRHPNAKQHGAAFPGDAGQVTGTVIPDDDGNVMQVGASEIFDPNHQRQGLGTAMYEAMYAHAKHHLGASHVIGDIHSTSAHATHQKLAAKHGMNYNSKELSAHANTPAGPFDEKFGPYSYALKSEMTKSERTTDAIVGDMLGHNHRLDTSLEAAKFLAAGKPVSDVRQALWEHDGNHDHAALHAYGLEINDKNLRALRGLKKLHQLGKAQEQPVKLSDIKPALPSGQDVAEAVERASAENNVRPIKLGGKHSAGTLLAVDPKTGDSWLLKPGDGPQGPQLGASEQPATQSEREAAFFHVVEAWGIGGYYPRCELLLIGGHQYAALKMLDTSFQTFNDICEQHPALPQHLFFPYLKNGILFKWAIADWILGQPDRNKGNVMARVEKSNQGLDDLPNVGESQPVRLIDEGSALDGVSFDPTHDRYSFVPYYLRASFDGNFNQLSGEERVTKMPRLDVESEKVVREWLEGLDEHRTTKILGDYHCVADGPQLRLSQIKQLAEKQPVDVAVNQLWALGGPTPVAATEHPTPDATPTPESIPGIEVAKAEMTIKDVAEALVKFRMADAPVDDRAILRKFGIAEADLRPSELGLEPKPE